MNQPPMPYFYPSQASAAAAGLYQDGGGATHTWLQDSAKSNQQYQPQWENSGGFHGGNNYGPGGMQVQGGGGQSRVQVPQQPQQPSQPPPTSTPPNLHGDMNKQPVMQNQQAQLNYAQQRQMNQNFSSFTRGIPQQQPRLPTHARTQIINNATYMSLPPGVLTQASPQTLVYPTALMYQQPRQGGNPYPNTQYMQQQLNFYPPGTPYYQQVIPQPTFQGMSSGGPSPQATAQPPQVPVMRPQMQNVPVVQPPVQPFVKPEPKKRPNAIKIINPNTNQEIDVNENGGNNNNITPTRSNDSSARETPQPNSGIATNNVVAADFAARVAARAIEADASDESRSSPETVQDIIPTPLSESETQHKQPPVVPSSEKVLSVLSTSSKEFIPTSFKPAQSSESPVEETKTPIIPTVSAETNSPAIEIQRPKEQFPALKNPTVPSGPANQSPMRVNSKKQKGSENERQYAAQAQAPPPSSDNKDSNKKGQRSSSKEEIMPPPPKERRERQRTVSKEQSPSPSPDCTLSQPEVPVVPAQLPQAKEVKRNITPPPVVAVEEPVVPAAKPSQHQNGETVSAEPSPSLDGNKTARQRNKKSGKMKDLNRKGVEKVGSEMDAFTTEPTNEERPSTPVSPPLPQPTAVSVPVDLIVPPPAELTPTPAQPVDKIKDDLLEKEDKLVTAKNEENAKVSALSKPEEPAPVIEKPAAPQLTLKRSYRKDQWSPLNPDGRKKYERDFLMDLKSEPNSNVKPDNLPDVVAVIQNSNTMRNQGMNFSMNRGGDLGGLVPAFLRNSQSQRGPPPKRGSQQGPKGGKGGNPKVIHVSLSLHEDVKLRTVENAWKPGRQNPDGETTEDEKQTQELFKNVRGILNKLTPQKFEKLMNKFLTLPINTEERLKGVIDLIFEKAVDEPNFSKAYANMCKVCSRIEITKMENGQETKVNFRKLLINRCQTEFESSKPEMLDSRKWAEDIRNCTDPEKKKELQLEYEEKERQLRMKSVGNIRFIGELFKLQMLITAIMYRCIEHLLSTPEEESLECLCKLLTTIGKDLENTPTQANTKQPGPSLNPYFQRMSELAQKKEGSKVSSRVRFMLQDVIELRHNKWIPRREDNNPKTIDQITKEAEREVMETNIALSQPPRMNRQNDRPDDRKKGRGGNQNDDGWTNVGNARHYNNKFNSAFEASKMQSMVKPDMDLNSLSLGGSSQFRFMSQAGSKGVENKSAPTFTSTNAFSALSRGDERKPPPQPNNNNRRITPTPSIERDKERQRMIQGFESDSGRGSRGNSVQRERPQPASRDSSAGGQPAVDNKETELNKPKPETDKREEPIDMEKLDRQTNTIFVEFLGGLTSVDDVRQEIEHLYNAKTIGVFIQKGLILSLEKKAGTQKTIGELITALMDLMDRLLSPELVAEQLGTIYQDADDIAIDVPKVWELQAQVVVPIISAEKMDFSHFKAACSSVLKSEAASKLFLPVLALLVKEKGAGFVRKVWDSSNVNLKDFLPPDANLDAFIKDNSLEYLTGEAPKYESSCNQASMSQVQEKMLRFMQSSQPYEKILDLISTNVGDNTGDLQFIRALITAICEACISSSNHSFDCNKFKQYEKLIQRFVDNKEDRELAALISVHNLVSKLEHPQGLMLNIFNNLLDNSLISSESFLKWRVDDSEKLENKGVSVYALTSFFAALEEADTDEDNS